MSNHDLDWLTSQQPQHHRPDPEARERALAALVQHTSSTPIRRRWNAGLMRSPRTLGMAAAAGAAAVAAVAVFATSGGHTGAGIATHGTRAAHGTQAPALHASVRHPRVHHALVGPPLVRLADFVSDSPAPSGDATVVARTTTTDSGPVTVYDLYADDGQYFFSPTQRGLAGQVSAHRNLAGGLFAREIAAAKEGVSGDVQTAAQDMADAPDPSHVISPKQTVDPAVLKAKEQATGQPQDATSASLFDNWVWEDSQDALIAGSGQPAVRAGVLRILATLPGVTVTHGTTDGQPTLVLTAGSDELGGGYTEQLTINADTGVPVQFVGGSSVTSPAATVDYKVSRVTIADLASGSAE